MNVRQRLVLRNNLLEDLIGLLENELKNIELSDTQDLICALRSRIKYNTKLISEYALFGDC